MRKAANYAVKYYKFHWADLGYVDLRNTPQLADLLRTDGHRFSPLKPQSDAIKALRSLVRGRDDLIATPINLGSSELVSINTLVSKVEKIAGVKMNRKYDLGAPQGVAGIEGATEAPAFTR